MAKKNKNSVPFHEKLVLNQWLLSLFGVESFDALTANMKAEELEGWKEDNVSYFYDVITTHVRNRCESLSDEDLLRYDENIYHHTKRMNAKRGEPIRWKYFQYLSLLFTEIYLDRFFRDRDALRAELNAYIKTYNGQAEKPDQIDVYENGLNKIAYWSATGSGKTLLMHINILQYQHYLQKSGTHTQLNRIILLTPNEGLSQQHLEEFEKSGLEAELFDKEGSRNLFTGHKIEIIDIHKLAEKMGDKTVAIDAFEGNNLVLVDEGHRGSSGKDWMDKRNKLCAQGFSFEYSATFGQAVKAANDKKLEQEYAKCILFDYSYKFFYNDGYGKDFSILNFETDGDFTQDERNVYLTACLLSFYQQIRFYEENREDIRAFNIEKPLCVFVGGSVNAVRTENKRKVSDVIDVLLFLALFVKEDQDAIGRIDSLLKGNHGLLVENRDIFAGAFDYLKNINLSSEKLYTDLKKRLFHSAQGQLTLDYLKGSDGEIALKIGSGEAFGVINVGDASTLKKLCEEEHSDMLNVHEKEFSGSYFRSINNTGSPINFLIGSKRFTEGWSSWRVSTMGLMNVGKKEGSEIIQLFGRGVRLKGYNFCLKRSDEVIGVKAPEYMKRLETLNIFGVRAGYMEQFNQYLEDEGLKPDGTYEEIVLPVLKHFNKNKKLKVIRLKKGMDYKKSGNRPALSPEEGYFARYPIKLDWYPKIQARLSEGLGQDNETIEKETHSFNEQHLAFLDFDQLYLDLQEYKAERGWTNLQLPKAQIEALLGNKPKWYEVLIPGAQMEFHNLTGDVMRWQEIASALMKKYVERFYAVQRSRWEQNHLEYAEMDENDPNLLDEYVFNVEKSKTDYISALQELKEAISKGELKELNIQNLQTFGFNRHMYEPLIHIGKGGADYIKVKPVHLNDGERQFVIDLRKFYEASADVFKDKELYLLRNQSRGTGLGFFDEGGFYPDFILWIMHEGKQYISFIDPKGIRNSEGMDDTKLSFFSSIKDIEKELAGNDNTIRLNSFIVSTTEHQSSWWGRKHKITEFNDRHVFFQQDQKDYVERIINQSLV